MSGNGDGSYLMMVAQLFEGGNEKALYGPVIDGRVEPCCGH